jgi:predicted dehydrogenase
MVEACRRAGVPLLVHENWRWQQPIQAVKQALVESGLGRPFRAHLLYANSYPVFENHPYLKNLEKFIIADIGSHLLDTARFFFGEAKSVTCQIAQVTPGIRGEDVATVLLEMGDGVAVVCTMSYASRLEHDRFNETYALIECEQGSVELGPDYWVRITTKEGTLARRHAPPNYPWIDPLYHVVQASIVPCHADLLRALTTGQPASTPGEDNLKTMELVYAAYESAQKGQVVRL